MIMISILSAFLILIQQNSRFRLNENWSKTKETKGTDFSFRTRNISRADYPHDFLPEASLYNITLLHYQMRLLKYLDNSYIGEVEKLHRIEDVPELLHNNSKYATNLFAGGLFRDW